MFVDSAVLFDTCIGNSAVKITHTLVAKLVDALLSKGRRKNLVVSSNLIQGTKDMASIV